MSDLDRTDNVLRKTAGGAGWTISWRMVTRALGFVSTLVLARILVPADFGLVALAMSFSTAIDIFGEMGVKEALIRATDSDRDTYDAAFTLSAVRGVLTTAVIVATAGLFTRSFGDPRLYWVVLALSTTVLLGALENVGVTDFRRNLNFQREFQLLIVPRLAQVVVTIALALIFASYWALVSGILTSRVLQTIASYVMHPFRPRLSLKAWRDIAGFSLWTWLLSMAWMIRDRVSVMMMGANLSVAGLGVFGVGWEIAVLPESELIGPLGRACFAGFAAARRGGLSVAETYLRVVSLALVLAVPATIGISAVAAPLVHVAFGANWLEATPVVQIMAAAGVFSVLRHISSILFNAFAYLRWLFSIAVVISVLQFALLVIFVGHGGIVGAAIALASAGLTEQALISILAFRKFAIEPSDFLSRAWRCLVASAVMTLFLVQFGLGWTASDSLVRADVRQLLVASVSGAAIYAAALLGLWLVSGRPNGPELDLLSTLKAGSVSLYGLISRRTALIWTPGSH
jgi:lipopolysaccharide exporter